MVYFCLTGIFALFYFVGVQLCFCYFKCCICYLLCESVSFEWNVTKWWI